MTQNGPNVPRAYAELLDTAVEAYKIFGEGSPKKFVIDPHNTTKLASAGKTSERMRGQPQHTIDSDST